MRVTGSSQKICVSAEELFDFFLASPPLQKPFFANGTDKLHLSRTQVESSISSELYLDWGSLWFRHQRKMPTRVWLVLQLCAADSPQAKVCNLVRLSQRSRLQLFFYWLPNHLRELAVCLKFKQRGVFSVTADRKRAYLGREYSSGFFTVRELNGTDWLFFTSSVVLNF